MLRVTERSQRPPTNHQKVKKWKLSNMESPGIIQSSNVNTDLKCFPFMLPIFEEIFLMFLRLKNICALKDWKREEKRKKLPKIVEENNCAPTFAAGIFKTCKFKGWMTDSTRTIGLELLPVKIILAASRFFFLQADNYLAIVFSLATVYQI